VLSIGTAMCELLALNVYLFSTSIPNFAFLACLVIRVIVSNSNDVCIMHNKWILVKFLKFLKF